MAVRNCIGLQFLSFSRNPSESLPRFRPSRRASVRSRSSCSICSNLASAATFQAGRSKSDCIVMATTQMKSKRLAGLPVLANQELAVLFFSATQRQRFISAVSREKTVAQRPISAVTMETSFHSGSTIFLSIGQRLGVRDCPRLATCRPRRSFV